VNYYITINKNAVDTKEFIDSLRRCTPSANEVECVLAISCHDQATREERKKVFSHLSPCIAELHEGTVPAQWTFEPREAKPSPNIIDLRTIATECLVNIGKTNVVGVGTLVLDSSDYYCYIPEDDSWVRLCYHELELEPKGALVTRVGSNTSAGAVRLVIRYWAKEDGEALVS